MFRYIKENFVSFASGFMGEQTSFERLSLRSLDLNSHFLAHMVYQYTHGEGLHLPVNLGIIQALEDDSISEAQDPPQNIEGKTSPKVTVAYRYFRHFSYLRPGQEIQIVHDYHPLAKDTIPFLHKVTISHLRSKNHPVQTYFFHTIDGRLQDVRQQDLPPYDTTPFKRDITIIHPWELQHDQTTPRRMPNKDTSSTGDPSYRG